MLENLSSLWWRRLPVAAGRFSQSLALALTDGNWLRIWAWLAALAPPAALVSGAVIGWEIGLPRGILVYSGSVILVCTFLALGTLSASLGLWSVLGYALANQVTMAIAPSKVKLFAELPAFLVAHALLALLCVIIPLASEALARHSVRRLSSSALETLTYAIVRIGSHAGLVTAWALAFPALIRPVWTWTGRGSPNVGSIATIQGNIEWIALCAVVLCVIRLLLDAFSQTQRRSIESAFLLKRLDVSSGTRHALSRWLSAPARVALWTLLLSGLVRSPGEALLLAGALALPIALEWILAEKAGFWIGAMTRIPLFLRIGGSLLVAFLVSQQILRVLWRTTHSFLPIIASLAATLVIFRLCIPETSRWARKRGVDTDTILAPSLTPNHIVYHIF